MEIKHELAHLGNFYEHVVKGVTEASRHRWNLRFVALLVNKQWIYKMAWCDEIFPHHGANGSGFPVPTGADNQKNIYIIKHVFDLSLIRQQH